MDPGRTRLRRAAHVPHRHSIHQHHHARQRALEPSPGAGRRGSAGGRGWRRPPRHLPHEQPGLECVVPQPGRLALRGHHHVGRRRDDRPPLDRRRVRRRRRRRRPGPPGQHARRGSGVVHQRRPRRVHRAYRPGRSRRPQRQHDHDADRRGRRRPPRPVRRQLQDAVRDGHLSATRALLRSGDPRGRPASLRGRPQVPERLSGGGPSRIQSRVHAATRRPGRLLSERRHRALYPRPVDLGPLPRRGRQAAHRRAGVLRAIGQVHRHRRRWRARSVRVRRLRGSGHVLAHDGTGTFRAVPRLAVRNTSNSSMAVDFSDVDRDGNVDILVVDMLGRGARRKAEIPTHTPLPKLIGQIDDRPQWQRNTLLRNRGDGTFEQIAAYAGIEASDWTWDVLFLDVDLDGYEDVLATTGHLWDVMDADTWERIRTTFTGAAWRRELALFPKLALRSVAFHNNGDLTFSDVGERWGFGGDDAISHGMATADLDGDGGLDVVVNRLNSPAAVFRDDAGAPRVAVRLRGAAPNTAGAGSKIRVLGGPVPVQQKEVVLGGTYLSGSDPLYTFAAGTAQDLTIEVDWRRRGHSVLRAVKPNREYEIIEPPPGPATARPAAVPAHPEAPWFRDVSTLLGHRHVETPYNDWTRQPLLPQALSQLGPGVTWYDVDGDGQEDLLITSGRGGVLAYYRNDRGRFNRVDLHVAPARYDETTALPLPDGKGGTTLLVGQSNYESLTPGEAAGVPSVLAITPGTGRTTPLIPGDVPSVGPLAVADVDGDGDLDLFVGGRVAPGAYPEPVSSRLFRNEGGRFVLDEVNTRLLQDVGMVSAAVFSDVNGDGWPDLIVAPEWGSLRLFLNDHGRFRDATADRPW